MKKHFKSLFSLIILIAILVLPYFVFAQTPMNQLQKVQPGSGYQSPEGDQGADIASIIGKAIGAFFSLLGVIFIILMLIGGHYYMIAGGNQDKVDKGLAYIRRGIVGLILVVGSYAIWWFVYLRLIAGVSSGSGFGGDF